MHSCQGIGRNNSHAAARQKPLPQACKPCTAWGRCITPEPEKLKSLMPGCGLRGTEASDWCPGPAEPSHGLTSLGKHGRGTEDLLGLQHPCGSLMKELSAGDAAKFTALKTKDLNPRARAGSESRSGSSLLPCPHTTPLIWKASCPGARDAPLPTVVGHGGFGGCSDGISLQNSLVIPAMWFIQCWPVGNVVQEKGSGKGTGEQRERGALEAPQPWGSTLEPAARMGSSSLSPRRMAQWAR